MIAWVPVLPPSIPPPFLPQVEKGSIYSHIHEHFLLWDSRTTQALSLQVTTGSIVGTMPASSAAFMET